MVDMVLTVLLKYEYFAMFGILALCGVGLPMPEEITLLGSGLLVGWHEADFWLASLACTVGILFGDCTIFGLGHHYGQRFLQSRPMQFVLTPQRQARVKDFFEKHGAKALFMARFVPGVRIGVYAFAGSQRVPWVKFVCLDAVGVLISGPTSILVGRWAATAFADDRDTAIAMATENVHRLGHWIIVAVLLGISLLMALESMRRARRQ